MYKERKCLHLFIDLTAFIPCLGKLLWKRSSLSFSHLNSHIVVTEQVWFVAKRPWWMKSHIESMWRDNRQKCLWRKFCMFTYSSQGLCWPCICQNGRSRFNKREIISKICVLCFFLFPEQLLFQPMAGDNSHEERRKREGKQSYHRQSHCRCCWWKGNWLGWRQTAWKRLQGPNAGPQDLWLKGAKRRHHGCINTSK